MKPPFNYTSTPLATCDDWSQVRRLVGEELTAWPRVDMTSPERAADCIYEEVWRLLEAVNPNIRSAAMREDFR